MSKQRREMLSSDAIALCYQQFAAARLEEPSVSPRMGTAPDVSINPILPDDPGSYQKASNRRRSLAGVQEIAPCARLDGGGGSGREKFRPTRKRDGDRRGRVPENDEVIVVFCNARQSILQRAERPSVVKTPSDALAPQTSLTVARKFHSHVGGIVSGRAGPFDAGARETALGSSKCLIRRGARGFEHWRPASNLARNQLLQRFGRPAIPVRNDAAELQ